MTKIKIWKNFFVTKICVAMQPRTCVRRPACQWLWYRHDEEREHRQDICRGMQMPCSTAVAELPEFLSPCWFFSQPTRNGLERF